MLLWSGQSLLPALQELAKPCQPIDAGRHCRACEAKQAGCLTLAQDVHKVRHRVVVHPVQGIQGVNEEVHQGATRGNRPAEGTAA